ncbi:hypothetical protein PENSUB_5113 [Penicillium subrubescens]|uniref:Uncharacterized protein n=1 Tax=Penicillium subrubescens TaxID=1316194 RepID=A0A1Q5UAQ3_9EURO|nr:hypothetical protein PENSUB_5113 [Penicillium subrubescens]
MLESLLQIAAQHPPVQHSVPEQQSPALSSQGRAELMLLYGADANTFLQGKTPLMRAIQHGSMDVLELLLSHKRINIRIQDREGENAMTYAVNYGTCAGKENLFKPLLDITIRGENGRTVLPVATCTCHIQLFHWLWIPFNGLRAKGGRGYGLKDWIRRTKSQR